MSRSIRHLSRSRDFMSIISFFGDSRSTKIIFSKNKSPIFRILCNICPKKGNNRQNHVTFIGSNGWTAHRIAPLHWATNIKEDNVGLLSFSKYGAYEFIDALAIDHCIGFFNLNGINYIVNKENLDDY